MKNVLSVIFVLNALAAAPVTAPHVPVVLFAAKPATIFQECFIAKHQNALFAVPVKTASRVVVKGTVRTALRAAKSAPLARPAIYALIAAAIALTVPVAQSAVRDARIWAVGCTATRRAARIVVLVILASRVIVPGYVQIALVAARNALPALRAINVGIFRAVARPAPVLLLAVKAVATMRARFIANWKSALSALNASASLAVNVIFARLAKTAKSALNAPVVLAAASSARAASFAPNVPVAKQAVTPVLIVEAVIGARSVLTIAIIAIIAHFACFALIATQRNTAIIALDVGIALNAATMGAAFVFFVLIALIVRGALIFATNAQIVSIALSVLGVYCQINMQELIDAISLLDEVCDVSLQHLSKFSSLQDAWERTDCGDYMLGLLYNAGIESSVQAMRFIVSDMRAEFIDGDNYNPHSRQVEDRILGTIQEFNAMTDSIELIKAAQRLAKRIASSYIPSAETEYKKYVPMNRKKIADIIRRHVPVPSEQAIIAASE